jgi:hypothetical protein
LVAALTGQGAFSRTQDVYDPLLEKVFRSAQEELEIVENIVLGEGGDPATDPRVLAARQALLGGRAPATNTQGIKTIDAALQATNGFRASAKRANAFRASKFFATGTTQETRAQILNRVDQVIGLNGRKFQPERVAKSAANQTAVSDLNQALDVLVQLNRMVATPSLTLLVNPANMVVSRSKKQTYQDRSRFNYIFQSWGEEQVRLSISGKSAGFVVGTPEAGEQAGTGGGTDGQVFSSTTPSGYQWASKNDSAGWQNLMNLFTLYRNNAYIYNQLDKSEAHLWIGNIQIMYDQWVYMGQFENFSYSFNENAQHGGIEFNFDFVASYVSDLSQAGVFTVQPYPAVTGNPLSAVPGPNQRASEVPAESPAAKSARAIQGGEEESQNPLFDPGTDPLNGAGDEEFPVFGDPSLFDDPNAQVIVFDDDPVTGDPTEPLPLPQEEFPVFGDPTLFEDPNAETIDFGEGEGTTLLGDPDAEFIDFEDEDEVVGG